MPSYYEALPIYKAAMDVAVRSGSQSCSGALRKGAHASTQWARRAIFSNSERP